ncbi:MAG: hypothetical protein ACKOZX_01755 [Gammaproteobacteria bacterium]
MFGKRFGSAAKVLVPVLVLGTVGLTVGLGFEWPAMQQQAAGTLAPAQAPGAAPPEAGSAPAPGTPEFAALHDQAKETYPGQPPPVAFGVDCASCHF